jgi:hypothetical protein
LVVIEDGSSVYWKAAAAKVAVLVPNPEVDLIAKGSTARV